MDNSPLKDSGQRRHFSTGSVRDVRTGKGRYDLLPAHAIKRLAQTFEKGADKYGDDNWRKGQPLRCYIDSALRHLFMFAEGHRDEDHAAQAMWNVAALIETEEMIRRGLLPAELGDLASYAEQVATGEEVATEPDATEAKSAEDRENEIRESAVTAFCRGLLPLNMDVRLQVIREMAM